MNYPNETAISNANQVMEKMFAAGLLPRLVTSAEGGLGFACTVYYQSLQVDFPASHTFGEFLKHFTVSLMRLILGLLEFLAAS